MLCFNEIDTMLDNFEYIFEKARNKYGALYPDILEGIIRELQNELARCAINSLDVTLDPVDDWNSYNREMLSDLLLKVQTEHKRVVIRAL